MLKSLPEFQTLTGTELSRIVEHGPVLITDQEQPKFVAQSVEAFETMVRRLRNLEQSSKRRQSIRSAKVILLRP
jgi:PHD/YefM family antitoxin component YafN of YafNO toxin-antitoxin module